MITLEWHQNADGLWEALSFIHDDGGFFKYKICQTAPLQFSIDDSSEELGVRGRGIIFGLATAQGVCEGMETEWGQIAKKESEK